MNPEEALKKLSAYAANIEAAKGGYVAVGVVKEDIGKKAYKSGAPVIKIAAAHEYGADIDHPGGTRFVVGKGGKASFVSNNFNGPVHGVTKAHKIKIPERSFLRMPFNLKADKLEERTQKEFNDVFQHGKKASKALGFLGIEAVNISKGAFTSGGYGKWPQLAQSTIDAKGSSQILIDTNILRSSITYAVRGPLTCCLI